MTVSSTASPFASLKSTAVSSASAHSNTHDSSMQLVLSPPKEEEYETLATILRDSFDVSGKAVWGDTPPEELLSFRTSVIRHRDSLRQLSEAGKVSTPHRLLVARNSTNTSQVIGFVVWNLDDDNSKEAWQRREEEDARLAIPLDSPPAQTNGKLWDQIFETFDKVRAAHMGERPTCYVKYLCIDNKVQRSGAGTALMKAIRKDAGNRPIYLEAAHTASSIQFYKKLGFTVLEQLEIGTVLYTVMILEPDTDSVLDYDAISSVSH